MEEPPKKQSRDSEILITGILLMAFAPFISDTIWLSGLVTAGGAAMVLVGAYLLRKDVPMKVLRLRGNRSLVVASLSAWGVGWAWVARLVFFPFPPNFSGFIEISVVGIIWLAPFLPFFAWAWKTMRTQAAKTR